MKVFIEQFLFAANRSIILAIKAMFVGFLPVLYDLLKQTLLVN